MIDNHHKVYAAYATDVLRNTRLHVTKRKVYLFTFEFNCITFLPNNLSTRTVPVCHVQKGDYSKYEAKLIFMCAVPAQGYTIRQWKTKRQQALQDKPILYFVLVCGIGAVYNPYLAIGTLQFVHKSFLPYVRA